MKKIKLVIGSILMLLGLTLVGEIHHFYLDNFMMGISSTTMYLQKELPERMIEDVIGSAKRNNVSFFVLDTRVKSTFEKEFYIYQNSCEVKEYLETLYDIKEKKYTSLFSGVLTVNYKNYENISDELLAENHTYYVIGKNKDIKNFKVELIDCYAGNHPTYNTPSYETRNMVIVIWAVIWGVALLLSLYDILLQQKEIYIRATYGESFLGQIVKNMMLDITFYLVVFEIAYCVLKKFTTVEFYNDIARGSLIIFLIINSGLYFRWLFLNARNTLIRNNLSAKILSVTYIVKCFTVVATMVLMASNLNIMLNSLEYRKQKEFFEEHKEYFYTNLEYKEIIDRNGLPKGDADFLLHESSKVREIFYQKYFDNFEPIILAYFGKVKNHDLILANVNACDYLLEELPELKSKIEKNKYYYIFPNEIADVQEISSQIDIQMKNYEKQELLNNREIVCYDRDKKILNIDEFSSNGSKYSKNPIIVLNNCEPQYNPSTIEPRVFKINYEHDIMFKLDTKIFEKFVEEFGLENDFHTITNVYEKYEHNWLILKRVLYINFVFSCLMLFLEIIVIRTIIKLEFKVNAMNISLKKVLGYTFIERYKPIIFLSTFFCVICLILGIIIGTFWNKSSRLSILFSGILIWCIEFSIIYLEIVRNERRNISNILKGEEV